MFRAQIIDQNFSDHFNEIERKREIYDLSFWYQVKQTYLVVC